MLRVLLKLVRETQKISSFFFIVREIKEADHIMAILFGANAERSEVIPSTLNAHDKWVVA